MIAVGVVGVVILVPAIVYLALRLRYKKYQAYVRGMHAPARLTRCSPPWQSKAASRTCSR